MSARKTRSLVLAAAAALLALLVAGCGGSSESTEEAAVTLKPAMAMMTAEEGKSSEGSAGMSEAEMEGMSEAGSGSEAEPEVMEGPTGMLMAATNAHGTAQLEQKGDKLTGTIKVEDLEPNSRHAAHLHGPDGSCEPQKMVSNMAVVLPELVANAKGVATAKFDFTVHQQVVEPGYFIMVHQEGNPPSQRGEVGAAPASPTYMKALSGDPGILCGDVEVKH